MRPPPLSALVARGLLAATSLLAATAAASPVDAPPPAVPEGPLPVKYDIQVALDEREMVLRGVETVTWRNIGPEPVARLPLRIDPNAWSRTDTRWVRDRDGAREILERGAKDAGFLAVDAVTDADGSDIGDRVHIDETLLFVALDPPVPPNESASLRIEFRTKLPRIVRRMGRLGRHIDAMQWFPKVCLQRPDGSFQDHPFRDPSEFAAAFCDYDVQITVPREYVVGATGVLQSDRVDEGNGTRTATYRARAVRDFAWCADPHFVRHARETDDGVEIELLNQPFLEPRAELILDSAEFAMKRLDEWLFPYPYPRLVIDAVPYGASGGMEYPMLVTIGSRTPEFSEWIRRRSDGPSGVTIHEYIHQYFYGMVANDEIAHAWLDEGLTTYLTYKVMDDFWRERRGEIEPGRGIGLLAREHLLSPLLSGGGPLAHLIGHPESAFSDEPTLLGFRFPDVWPNGARTMRFSGRKESYVPFANAAALDTIAFEALRTSRGDAYRAFAYSKPCLMLRTLENRYGFERVRELLRLFARRHAFSHPDSGDFLLAVSESLGPEAERFVRQCVETSAFADWSVETVRVFEHPGRGFSRQRKPGDPVAPDFPPEPAGRGLIDRVVLAVGRDAGDEEVAEAAGRSYVAEVWVQNRGELRHPVEVEFEFEDGHTERVSLDGERGVYRLEVGPRDARLRAARVDPDRVLALDLDVTNNARLARPDRAAARAAASQFQLWIQTVLALIAWYS